MSENKGIMLAKSMQKHAGRAKEKILQNLGKVDRTADEIFDDHLNNFNRQQANAAKLQKEFSNYIRCIRAAQLASKSLMDTVYDVYEPQWVGFDALQEQVAASENLWADFAHKLGEQVLIPLNTYSSQFPEMKKKIEKRNRKLIDYDGQRHSFQNLQSNANKRKDDAKLTKGREQLEEARRTYEILNTELHDELPALYDARILFLVTNIQTLFATEQVFHSETAKIYAELEAIVDKLATESQRGSNSLHKQGASNALKLASPAQTPNKPNQLNNSNSSYQNQITTNGGGASLANSPSPSSSAQEPKLGLDNVSSISESTPDYHKPSVSTTTASTSTTTSTPNSPLAEPTHDHGEHEQVTVVDGDGVGVVALSNNLGSPSRAAIDVESAATATQTANNNDNDTKSTPAVAADTEDEAQKQHLNGNENSSNQTVEQQPAAACSANSNSNGNSNSNSSITVAGAAAASPKQLGNRNGRTLPKRAIAISKNPFEDDDDVDVDVEVETGAWVGEPPGDHQVTAERIYEMPFDATTDNLPPGVLYRVIATYSYIKEDVDELSFEIGEIIRVIEYDDPEDQEEGWLMGQKETTNEKGLFPANFTSPL